MARVEQQMPPILINSFPKSGTHLMAQVMSVIAEPNEQIVSGQQYLATHQNGGWGPGLRSERSIMEGLRLLQPGQYAGAHLAAALSVMDWAAQENIPVIFLYRDLRDLTVSETYHLEGQDRERQQHPFKSQYAALGSHQERLRAVITGYAGHPSLRDRWEQYAAWLTTKRALPVRFRDIRLRPKETCTAIIGYLYQLTGLLIDTEYYVPLMMNAVCPEASPTYRAGRVGDWRDEFDEETSLLADLYFAGWTEALGFDEELEPEPGAEGWIRRRK